MEAKGNALNRGCRILSPLDNVSEVETLADAGADEFYAGVLPDKWLSREVAVNRRSFAQAQFSSEVDLAQAVILAAKRGIPVHLTLNAPFYHADLYPDLLSFARRAADFGVAGFIVGDPGLLKRLHDFHPGLQLTLSTMAGTMNAAAVGFYKRFGIKRAVLPRHLTLSEMAGIVRAHPELEFEAFVLIGKCPNEEAYCTFQHTNADKRWPCEIPCRILPEDDRPLKNLRPVRARQEWLKADRRMGCGLCAIPKLKEIGVGIMKLVGRGGPTQGKRANVVLARKYADMTGEFADARGDYLVRFKRPCVGEICYFPEIFRAFNP